MMNSLRTIHQHWDDMGTGSKAQGDFGIEKVNTDLCDFPRHSGILL